MVACSSEVSGMIVDVDGLTSLLFVFICVPELSAEVLASAKSTTVLELWFPTLFEDVGSLLEVSALLVSGTSLVVTVGVAVVDDGAGILKKMYGELIRNHKHGSVRFY